MTVQELNAQLMECRARAISARRQSILTVAQRHRENASLYKSMGLYSVAAFETIKAAKAEQSARELTAAAVEVLL